MSKKISALSIAVLVLAGTFAGISSASAATPYKACKPAKAKATIGKLSYTCAKNPASASASLVWVSKPCIDANKSYLSAKSLAGAVTTSFDGRISSSTRLKASNERLIITYQKDVDTWSAKLSYWLAKLPNVKVSGTTAEKGQIAAIENRILRSQQKVVTLQELVQTNDAQIKEATDGKAKTEADLANAKASISTACK